MKINGKKIILRDLTIKDAKDLAENANDKEVNYFTDDIPYPYRLKDARWFIGRCMKKAKEKPRKAYNLGIELKSKKQIIGMISLMDVDKKHKRAEVGYWIGKQYRKKGLSSEAEGIILNFAFKRLKLNKIYGEAMLENKGSNTLFKKFGFRKVGILKEEMIKKGRKKDSYLWELLKKDWKK